MISFRARKTDEKCKRLSNFLAVAVQLSARMIFMNVFVVITVAMVMLLSDFEPYGIIIYDVCVVTVAMVMLLRDFFALRDNYL
jgi:hypothetical protein